MAEMLLSKKDNTKFSHDGICTFLINAAKVTFATPLKMGIRKRLYILNIAKHSDTREPLEILRGIAYNYDIN